MKRHLLLFLLCLAGLAANAQSERVFEVKKNIVIPLDSLLKIWIMPGLDTLNNSGTYSFPIISEMDNYFDKFACTGCGMGRENDRVYFEVMGSYDKPDFVLMKFYRTDNGKSTLVGHRFFTTLPNNFGAPMKARGK